MRAAIVAAALVVVCAGCGPDLWIGQVRVSLVDNVEPWPDLPEALADMQSADTGAPDETWDIDLHLYPDWHVLPSGPHKVCVFKPWESLIEARVTGADVADGCLPHEFAHQWVYVTHGLSAALKHDSLWAERETILRKAAR